MYSVFALVAIACLLAQTAYAADDDILLSVQTGHLPAHYNRSKDVEMSPKQVNLDVDIAKLFDLGNRKPIAVKLEVIDPLPPSLIFDIDSDLRSARVHRIRFPRPKLEPDIVHVSIEDHINKN